MEADRQELRRLVTEALEWHRMTVREFAAAAGVSHSTITQIQNMNTVPSPQTCRKLARWLRVEEDELLVVAGHKAPPGEGRKPRSRAELLDLFLANDAIEVEYYDMATASASSLRHLLSSDPSGYRFLPNRGRFKQGRIKVIGVRGDCMEPEIHDGEDVYFDTRGELEEDVTVLAAVDDSSLVVKTLRSLGDGWELVPEDGGPPIPLESEEQILGVVVGVWRPLVRSARKKRGKRGEETGP